MLSPAQKCRRNGWKVGTVLKSVENLMGDKIVEYWYITAIGVYEVLGIRKDFAKSDEKYLDINDKDFRWRKVSNQQHKMELLKGFEKQFDKDYK